MTTPTIPALPDGVTPMDLADQLHRSKLDEPDFDPIEEGRDLIRAACSKLLDAIAYMGGNQRQLLFDEVVKAGDPELTGDERLLDILDTLAIWTANSLQKATGKADD